jgi:hypothetical protein
MKKFLVLFVGLAILAGSVCALDLPDALKIPGLVVTGDVNTGFRVTGESWADYNDVVKKNHSDPQAFAYSSSIDDGTPFRAQLQLVWTRGDLGVKTRLRYTPAQGRELKTANLFDFSHAVNKAFVWGDLFDKKVRVIAGKGLDGAWGLFYSNWDNTGDFDGVDGVKVEVKPIDGLNVGVAYGSGDGVFGSAFTNSGDPWASERRLVAGAKYSNETFGLMASLYHNFLELDQIDSSGNGRYYGGKDSPGYGAIDSFIESSANPATHPDLASNRYSLTGYNFNLGKITEALPRTSNLLVGAKVTPPSIPLTVQASAAFNNIGANDWKENALTDEQDTILEDNEVDLADYIYKGGDFSPYWYTLLKFNVEYAASDALTIGLGLSDMYIADRYYFDEAEFNVLENGNRYPVGGLGGLFPISINPYVSYTLNDAISLGGDLSFKINRGGSDQFGFGVQPSATFQLGSGATFNVYDEIVFTVESGNADDAEWVGKHPGAVAAMPHSGAGYTENTFHIEFGWTF